MGELENDCKIGDILKMGCSSFRLRIAVKKCLWDPCSHVLTVRPEVEKCGGICAHPGKSGLMGEKLRGERKVDGARG